MGELTKEGIPKGTSTCRLTHKLLNVAFVFPFGMHARCSCWHKTSSVFKNYNPLIHPSTDPVIYISIYLYTHLSIHAFAYPLIYPSSPSIYLLIHSSTNPCIFLSIYPSMYRSVHPHFHPSIKVVCISAIHLRICMRIHSSIHPFIFQSTHSCICPSPIHLFLHQSFPPSMHSPLPFLWTSHAIGAKTLVSWNCRFPEQAWRLYRLTSSARPCLLF